jgi:hypothetical protein
MDLKSLLRRVLDGAGRSQSRRPPEGERPTRRGSPKSVAVRQIGKLLRRR